MSSETIFLQPIGSTLNPNFANAKGATLFSNYSHTPSGTLTAIQAQTLVQGGTAIAIAEASAVTDFQNDPNFSFLYNDSTGIGLDGSYTGNSNIETKVVANFAVGANQTFSFNFTTALELTAKEIENPNAEYNQAKSKATFIVLDTTDVNKPIVIDYFGMRGRLISSEKDRDLRIGGSRNVRITNQRENVDINGNNGIDSVMGGAIGTYQRRFRNSTNITIVEVNASAVTFTGDTLIGNLGQDVIYGSIRNDDLNGCNGADKIYGSLGNDKLNGRGGDDILEGGQGNDRLVGELGNDRLHGGLGDDILIGGRGNDILVGGDGSDQFIFKRSHLLKDDCDVIQDFQVGIDKIVLKGWDNTNADQWLNQMRSLGNITNTNNGVLFRFDGGQNEGTLLLTGVSSNQINSQSIIFA